MYRYQKGKAMRGSGETRWKGGAAMEERWQRRGDSRTEAAVDTTRQRRQGEAAGDIISGSGQRASINSGTGNFSFKNIKNYILHSNTLEKQTVFCSILGIVSFDRFILYCVTRIVLQHRRISQSVSSMALDINRPSNDEK